MKRIICLLTLLLPLFAFAQNADTSNTSPKKIHHQIGINATAFIKQFLSFNNTVQQGAQNPYFINYKILGSNSTQKRFIGGRVGFGYNEANQSGSPNPNFEQKAKQSLLAARIGAEVQQKLTSRWTWYYGLDFIYNSDILSTTTKSVNGGLEINTTTKEETIGKGGGPVFGMQFSLNDWLSLSTEAAFYYMDMKNTTSMKSDFPGSQMPDDEVLKLKSMGFVSPAFINFNIMF